MSLNSENFWLPKSVFKGKNADGTSFKMTEWEPGSFGDIIGNGATMGYMVLVLILLISTPIILPIMLIYCVCTYNGRIQIATFVSLLISIYPLYCIPEKGRIFGMHKVAYGESHIPNILAIIVGTVVAQIALIGVTIVTRGSLYHYDANIPKPFHYNVLGIAIVAFFMSYFISLQFFR